MPAFLIFMNMNALSLDASQTMYLTLPAKYLHRQSECSTGAAGQIRKLLHAFAREMCSHQPYFAL